MRLRANLALSRTCVDRAVSLIMQAAESDAEVCALLSDLLVVEMQYVRSQRFLYRFQRYDQLERELLGQMHVVVDCRLTTRDSYEHVRL